MSSNAKTKQNVFDVDIASILESIPGYIYWKNLDSVYMGCNRDFLNAISADSMKEVIGKTEYEMPWGVLNPDIAARFTEEDKKIIATGERMIIEDSLGMKNSQGLLMTVRTEKRPLRNKNGNIVGVLGIGIDISEQREAEKLEVDTNLMLDLAPGYIYWKDLNSIYLGFNQNFENLISHGFNQNFENLVSPEKRTNFIGLSEYEMPWALIKPETAAHNVAADLQVINTGEILVTEEDLGINKPNGSTTILRSEKRPLKSRNGSVIGVLGVSVDITAQKEAERLRLESERQQITLQEKEKFTQLARKVAHDINSPLAALKMMIPLCTEIPENKRMLLTRATEGILDIANNLLNNYRKEKNSATSDIELRQPLLVSDLLIELLSEKKMQFRNHPIAFDTVINLDAQFAFIEMQTTEFRRSISNLINNAADALGNKTNGLVSINLNADDSAVILEVGDNGKGMTAAMIEKMLSRQSFTEGKENGNGLGLQQVWDTLDYNQGAMDVQSMLTKGTLIKLTFPRIAAPEWIAQNIHIAPDNIVLILDDDESIHTAWDLRFTPLLTSYPTLRTQHFTQGQEALVFLASLSQEEKNLVVFLSDYELLQQSRNGLEVIKESGIKRAILVTSYYSNPKVRENIDQLGIKMLPKQMASIIPIIFANEKVLSDVNNLQIPVLSREVPFKESIDTASPKFIADKKMALQKTQIVLLDDNQMFADSLIFRLSHNKVVTHYADPKVFLDECEKYPKDTPICIDNNFGLGAVINGTQVAEQLHELKFTRLFIVSGDHFEPGALPNYVTLIYKTNLEPLDTL